MTLQIYNSKTDIPAELQEHYVKRSDGKYEPEVEGYTSLSGLLAKKEELQLKVRNHSQSTRALESEHEAELLEQKKESDRKIQELETKLTTKDSEHATEVEELKKQVRVPEDQVALPKEKAELLPKYEALGSPEELTTLKEKAEELSAKDAAAQKLASLETVAKVAKIPNVKAFAKLAVQFGLNTEVIQVSQGANKDPIEQVNVIEADGTKRVLNIDYLKENDDFAVFADSLMKPSTSDGSNGTRGNGGDKKHVRQESGDNGNESKDGAVFFWDSRQTQRKDHAIS